MAAVAWYALFKTVDRRWSAVAAWMRVTFAGLFAVIGEASAIFWLLVKGRKPTIH